MRGNHYLYALAIGLSAVGGFMLIGPAALLVAAGLLALLALFGDYEGGD